MSKLEAYDRGLYCINAPDVYTGRWDTYDWINYIDSHGHWQVEVSDDEE